MLEDSQKRLDAAPADRRGPAERMAATIRAAQMIEDLIPADEARTIAAAHRADATEEWKRMVHACLLALDERPAP